MSGERYGTGLTGAAYNLLTAIEYGDRANVHGWSVALRKELDAYLAGALLADTPSVEPSVERVRLTMIDGIGAELSRKFAQGNPFEPFDRVYVVKTITRVLDAARDRTRKAALPTQASDSPEKTT